MSNQGVIEAVGTVEECLPGTMFRIVLDEEVFGTPDHIVHAKISGKMRKFRVRILPGDRVRLEISPYDLTKGRIVFREKAEKPVKADSSVGSK